MPDQPGVGGLLALMVLTEARRRTAPETTVRWSFCDQD
jgi:predicted RNA polymerase sigma factor